MSDFIWPMTLITVSVIWAAAWVTVERMKYEEGLDEPLEEEE